MHFVSIKNRKAARVKGAGKMQIEFWNQKKEGSVSYLLIDQQNTFLSVF